MRRFALAVVAALVLSGMAQPSSAQNLRICTHTMANDAVDGCGRLLARGNLSAKQRDLVLVTRGIWHARTFDANSALADFNESIRLNTPYSEAYAERGAIQLERGNFAPAIADLNKALALPARTNVEGLLFGGKSALIYLNRGKAHKALGNIDAALGDYTEYLSRTPGASTADHELAERAQLWAKKGDIPRALNDYNEAISRAPNNVNYYQERGRLYSKAGSHNEAIADFGAVLKTVPDSYDARIERAQAHERNGDLKAAIGDYSFLQRKFPSETFSVALARLERALAPAVQPQPAGNLKHAAIGSAPAALPASAERRVALVIGNSAYANATRLPNPRADAEVLAASLRRIGFSAVETRFDLSRDQLLDALKSFAAEAARADWAVVYFAGHGIEIGGVNYLVPVDAKLASDRDITFEAVALEHVLNAVDGAKKLRLAILDACRDNPFAKSMARTMTATRSLGRGLAQIEPPRATLVAYAARHGQVALDGKGGNSPYVSALIKHIETPGLEINLLLRKVRDDVLALTGNEQEPFFYGSLPGEGFFFRTN